MIYISRWGIRLLGAGTVINPIIKVVTTVAVLAAVYFFIVKPILDTTEETIDRGFDQAEQIQDSVSDSISDSQIESLRTGIASRLTGLASTWPEAARELRACAKDAGRDGLALADCDRFADKVTGMQSDRSFATSYATSLRAQGDTAGADRVEQCVDDAGFDPQAMGRCRNLADELLFG